MTHKFVRLATVSLLGSVSLFGLSSTARASHVMFSTDTVLSNQELTAGREVTVSKGTTQIALDNGGLASFVDSAQFSLRPDGSIDLRSGSVTVVSPSGRLVDVHMPEGVRGSIEGANASASFTVGGKGAHGSAIAGRTTIAANGVIKAFAVGSFWSVAGGHAPEQIVAATPAAVPALVRVQPMREGGIVAVAENGVPVALGEALAAAGAHGDILTAARRIDAYDRNPSLIAFPQGDYVRLTAYAAQASAPFGGAAFNGAAADIVRTYFEYLAKGGVAGDFRTGYARILLSYLDLLRAGALPSSFNGATQAQLSAYIAFIGRTDGFGALSSTNRNLLDAYLSFLTGGGTPDGFNGRATSLVTSYLDYVRAGGDPAKFTQASQSVVTQYLQILQSGAIKGQLSVANQALLDAYLASVARSGDGLAFSNSAASSLASFTVYLNGGGFPSQYTAVDAATLRSYLETLDATGLFDRVLGGQAAFLRTYLSYLRTGAPIDNFDKLPINILTAQAGSLSAFAAFLNAGGKPSAYTQLSADQITAYLAALQSANRFALTGANAKFFADYYAYLQGGGTRDAFAGLPINILTSQASALNAYYVYIQNGGTPSLYTGLTQTQVLAYFKALQDSGLFVSLIGANASFLSDYYAFLVKGGNPDVYAGLPNVDLNAYAGQLSTFVAYLKSGRLPSSYTALTGDQIRAYLNALSASGKLTTLLGGDAAFLNSYLVYLQGGGAVDAFAGLPVNVYASYGSQLTAYFAYLNAGGLPSGYTALTAAQIRSYLDLLSANNQLATVLGANATFYTNYLAYLVGGGNVDAFSGLPIVTYQSYANALTAYFAYLNAGGLPSGYTVLTAAQIRTYLDTLAANNQLAALLGGNANFFSQYLAYLTTGASADAYTGLPIVTYRGYATALSAFYAYLAGGGKPSAYTVLTQAQIRTYLDALKAAGQSTVLLGANATFFDGYLTYLASGAAPDQYASLPGSPAVAVLSNAGVFVPVASSAQYSAALPSGAGSGSAAVEFTAGTPTKLTIAAVETGTTVVASRGTAKTVEAGGDQYMSIGRWTDGRITIGTTGINLTATQGLPFLVAAPRDTLPTGGTIDYSIFAKTGVTRGSATLLPGVFDAKMRIAFNAISSVFSRVALFGTIVMPDAGATNTTYTIGSQAIYDATATQGTQVNFGQPLDFFQRLTLTSGTGVAGVNACPDGTNCAIHFSGAVAGPNAARVGFAYNTQYTASFGQPNGERLEGAVIFGANGTFTPGSVAVTPTPAPTPTPTPTTAVSNGITLTSIGGSLRPFYVNASNGIESFTASNNTVVSRGTAAIVESGATPGATAEDRIYWTRWSGGKTTGTDVTQVIDVPANGGFHILHLPDATAIPVSGTAQYTLVGGTSPTVADGSVAPGIFTGTMGVDFKSAKVGIDFNVAIGGFNYAIATAGKATAPTNGGLSFATFVNGNGAANTYGFNDLIPVTTGGPACTGAATCTAYVTGLASGAGASGFGVQYAIQPTRGSAVAGNPVSGVAAFTGKYTPAPVVAAPAPTGTGLFYRAFGPLNYYGSANYQAVIVAQPDGKLDSFREAQQNQQSRGTNTDHEFGTVGGVLGWSRWSGGQTSASFPYTLPENGGSGMIWGTPTANVEMPTSGSAIYTMVGSTAPVASNGSLAPGSVKSAQLGVAFQSKLVGFQATVGIGGTDYSLSTSGGAGAPSMPLIKDISTNSSNTFGGYEILSGATVNGGSCAGTGCKLRVAGFLAGANAGYAGVTYLFGSGTATNAPDINGAIAFAKSAVATSGLAPTGAGLNVLEINGGSISGTKGPVYTIVAQPSGQLTTDAIGYSRGTAGESEYGGLNGVIGWSRWTNGTIKTANATSTLSPGGEHHVWGTALSNMPTTGSATYDLVGSTAPTTDTGATGSVLSASLTVGFATKKVGLDASVSVGGQSFAFGSTGGAAAPSMDLATNGTFSQTATGNQMFGFLAGSGAAAAGLAFTVTPPTLINGVTSVSGTLAFGKRP